MGLALVISRRMRLTRPRPSAGGWRLRLDRFCHPDLVARTALSEVMGQIPKNIAATPYRLDVMISTGRLGKFLA